MRFCCGCSGRRMRRRRARKEFRSRRKCWRRRGPWCRACRLAHRSAATSRRPRCFARYCHRALRLTIRAVFQPSRRRRPKLASFEESLTKLEKIVAPLEGGDLNLEDSVRLFEEGTRLSADCRKQLEEAEGKVELLVKQRDGAMKREPFGQ